MTTILADMNLGVMVSDSCANDGDRVYSQRKVFRVRGALLGFAGNCNEAMNFLAWWKAGCPRPAPKFSNSDALVLSASGLVAYNNSCTPTPIESGSASIGSGGKAVMCAHEALGMKEPTKAVAIVYKYDLASRKPVRTYRL